MAAVGATVVAGVLGASVVVEAWPTHRLSSRASVSARSTVSAKGQALPIACFPSQMVVPHPRNRGGGAVKSLRTKQLTGEILANGCDPVEAATR